MESTASPNKMKLTMNLIGESKSVPRVTDLLKTHCFFPVPTGLSGSDTATWTPYNSEKNINEHIASYQSATLSIDVQENDVLVSKDSTLLTGLCNVSSMEVDEKVDSFLEEVDFGQNGSTPMKVQENEGLDCLQSSFDLQQKTRLFNQGTHVSRTKHSASSSGYEVDLANLSTVDFASNKRLSSFRPEVQSKTIHRDLTENDLEDLPTVLYPNADILNNDSKRDLTNLSTINNSNIVTCVSPPENCCRTLAVIPEIIRCLRNFIDFIKKSNLIKRKPSRENSSATINVQNDISTMQNALLGCGSSSGGICSFLLGNKGRRRENVDLNNKGNKSNDSEGFSLPNGIRIKQENSSSALPAHLQTPFSLIAESGSPSMNSVCYFIAGNSQHQPSDLDSSSDEDDYFLGVRRRKRRKRDYGSGVGNNIDKLFNDALDDPWAHLRDIGEDPTSALFQPQPEPVVEMTKLDKLFDKMSEFHKTKLLEPSEAVKTTLLDHQKMALFWMRERENTNELPPFWETDEVNPDNFVNKATCKQSSTRPKCINGGILADDMGLGKTLAMISLILTNHVNCQPMFTKRKRKGAAVHASASSSSADEDPLMCEMGKTGEEETPKFNVKRKREGYFKTSRTKNSDMEKPGYQFRKLFLSQICKEEKKKKKKDKKKKMKPEKASPESGIDISDDSDGELDKINKTVASICDSPLLLTEDERLQRLKPKGDDKSSAHGTLIVCPMSVLSNWINQFQIHVDPSVAVDFKCYVYYGQGRVKDMRFLNQQDVVITTYLTLTNEHRQGNSPLHKVHWLRVVLDEGHFIRNARTHTSIAMINLMAKRRWIITGTPIQNRMTDLWTVLKFLKLEPFVDKHWWQRIIVGPMKCATRPRYNRVQKLMRHISIRRLKTDKIDEKPLVKLPNRKLIIVDVELDEEERKVYDRLQKNGELTLKKFLRRGVRYVMRNYANVLVIITRLRQLCLHPILCKTALKDLDEAEKIMDQLQQRQQNQRPNNAVVDEEQHENADDENRAKLIQQLIEVLAAGDSEECSICLENLTDPVITKCAHVFCRQCILDVIDNSGILPSCPLCRGDVEVTDLINVPEKPKEEEKAADVNEEEWRSSSKINELMSALEALREKNPFIKSLVVSQFTSFLDLIAIPLRRAGFHFTRIDGRMRQADRAAAIESFNKKADDTPTVMLLSLMAGGVGLNLTGATRVFLLDPAWNPAVEEQCFDRCHRLGQQEDVIITKYVVMDSIEQRMLTLQEQKKELMEKAFGISVVTNEQRINARLQDLKTLIGI